MEAFPELHLEDKVNFKGEGVETNKELVGHIRKIQNVWEEEVETHFLGTTGTRTLIFLITELSVWQEEIMYGVLERE